MATTYTLTHLGGTTDHRASMQALIDGAAAGDTVVIPANATTYTFTTPADPGDGTSYFALELKSGTAGNVITYTINGDLVADGASFAGTHACFIGVNKKSYITINGSGSVSSSALSATEFRHNLMLRGSDHITIDGASGLTLVDSKSGDNLYIGPTEVDQDANRTTCSVIVVNDLLCSGARRNNVTVLSANNLRMNRCSWTDAAGTSPQAGIDFEPEDDARDELTNIILDGCVGYGNASRDFLVNLSSMTNGHPTIDVIFRNCICRRGTRITPRGFEAKHIGAQDNTGTIRFEGCRSTGLDNEAMWFEWVLSSSVDIEISGFLSDDCARTASKRALNFVLTGTPGTAGILFENTVIHDKQDKTVLSVTSPGGNATNVTGTVFLDRAGAYPGVSQVQSLLPNLTIRDYARSPKLRTKTSLGRLRMSHRRPR